MARPAKPSTAMAPALGADRKGVGHEVLAEDAAKPRQAMIEQPRRARIEPQGRAVAVSKAEGDLRLGERKPLHDIGDCPCLGALGFHELEPRRRRVEQIAHLDARAAADRCWLERRLAAAIDGNLIGICRRRGRGS